MSCSGRDAIEKHLPRRERKGCVLVVSDHRALNLGHATTLCRHGYAVYTAVTCTDVPRVFAKYDVGQVDLVVFASLVHGWHHLEGEERPGEIPAVSDREWQTRNMRAVIDMVCARQEVSPRALIAVELMAYGWYAITAEALERAGVQYATYSVSDPHAIVEYLE